MHTEQDSTAPTFNERRSLYDLVLCYLSNLCFFPAVLAFASLEAAKASLSSEADYISQLINWGFIALVCLHGIFFFRNRYFARGAFSLRSLLTLLNSLMNMEKEISREEFSKTQLHLFFELSPLSYLVIAYALIFACMINHVIFVVIAIVLWQYKESVAQKIDIEE